MNNRLRELSIPYLANFTGELKQDQDGIGNLRWNPIRVTCSPRIVELGDDDDIVDLIRQPFQYKGEVGSESGEKKDQKKHENETDKERVMRKALKQLWKDKEARIQRMMDKVVFLPFQHS